MRPIACLALLPCLVFVACQPRSEQPANPTTEPPRQRLFTATISDPKTFNPIIAVDASSASVTSDLFDGLVRQNPLSGEEEPALAERWEYGDEGKTLTFHLRHNVHWHDGKPFTAADVVFTFGAVFDDRVPNSIKHVLLVDGERVRVEAVDDYTVRVRTPRPFAPLIHTIGVGILPRHVLGDSLQAGTFAQQWGIDTAPEKLVGTGAYKMSRYVPGQFVEYVRNPDYWMKDENSRPLPYLDGQTELIVPNQDATYLKFLAGQTHVHSPRPEEVADLRTKAGELAIAVDEIGLETGTTFVAFNRNRKHYEKDGAVDPRLSWFTDRNFLRAIAHAVDKQSMIVNCLNGYGKPAVSETSPEIKLYHNPNLTDYAYDLDESRRLLKEAGYVDHDGDGVLEDAAGHALEFSFTTNAGNQVREKMASILREDWTKLGLKVNYRPLDFQALVEKLDSSFDWDAVLIAFTGSLEPNNGANLLRSSANLHFWNPNQPKPATEWEAEIDRLLEEGTRALESDKRRPIYWRIQEILHEQLPMIPTVRQTQFVAYKRALQNYRPTVWGLYRPELIRFAPG